MKDKVGCILGDEMGLGKTVQALVNFGMDIWMNVKRDPSRELTCLVMCPAALRGNWSDEIQTFTKINHLVPKGGLMDRFIQIERFKKQSGHKIIVLNYDLIEDHIQQLNSLNIDMVIYDEAHYLKNSETERYKSAVQVNTKRRILLTGTPMTNQVDDMWTLLDMATPGWWGTFAGFRAKYCVLGGHNGKQVISVKNEKQLNSKLSQVMLRRRVDDVIDLPEVRVIQRQVSLVGRPREMYNYLATEHKLAKYVPDWDEDREANLEFPMVRATRMRQICATTAALDRTRDESPKLDLAIEDAKEILESGHKLIVFTQFRPVIDAYKRRMAKAMPGVPIFEITGTTHKDKRQGVVKQWSNTEGPAICIGIIKAMGTGLNMTAAHNAQFIDKMFSPAENNQAIGRLRRIGSERHGTSISIFEYYVRNSAEYRVEQILKDKAISFDAVVEGTTQHRGFMERLSEALEGTL